MKKILLTQGKVALVDDEDFKILSSFKWCAAKAYRTYYAVSRIYLGNDKCKTISMHRVIMGAPNGVVINHWDHDGLNNTRQNLILATNQENGQYRQKNLTQKGKPTSSQYKGVSYDESRNKWYAKICFNGENKNLGRFNDEIDAAFAYDKAALIYFDEFAKINFPRKINE